jgi:hypothetical protein
LLNPIADPAAYQIENSSAWAKLFARDDYEPRSKNALQLGGRMKRTAIRAEPISTYLERRRKGPIYRVIVAGETVYVSGLPPFDPETGTKA